MRRRSKGATLSLVAVIILVIITLGVGCYFLAKILGGGQEVTNATDAGTLNVARLSIVMAVPDSQVPTIFKDMEYPAKSGISLLSYNRCVAKALMIAINANQENSSTAVSNVQSTIFPELDALGKALTKVLNSPQTVFNGNPLANSMKMWGNNAVTAYSPSGPVVAYMKPGGATNVYFTKDQFTYTASNGTQTTFPAFGIPLSSDTAYQPLPNGTQYLAGYAPIRLPGFSSAIYGVPVFPQQRPHLVSLGPFLGAANPAYGNTPPNSFRCATNSKDSKTNAFGGAVACAIVGAVGGSIGGGGIGGAGGGGPLGSGFQFFGAIPNGYIEFDNAAANSKPPGYDPADYEQNIYNNELSASSTMEASGTGSGSGGSQYANQVMFSQVTGGCSAWIKWANGQGPVPSSPIYFGPRDAKATLYSSSNLPTGSVKQAMAQCGGPQDCIAQLDNTTGMSGFCLSAIGAMETTFNHPVPSPTQAKNQQNFSQADWAKASVLAAFENPQAQPAGQNSVTVDLTDTPISGLGVFPWMSGSQGPAQAQNAPVPWLYQMPIEAPGSIYALMHMVMNDGCYQNLLAQITQRCQQIQPQTTSGQIDGLLKSTTLQMAPAGSSQPQKVFLALQDPVNNPMGPITVFQNGSTPPGYSSGNSSPDGNTTPGASCSQHTVYLDGTIVDSEFDQNVHDRPYVNISPSGNNSGLYVIDFANWTPSSGANNCLGNMSFSESGLNTATFTHIN